MKNTKKEYFSTKSILYFNIVLLIILIILTTILYFKKLYISYINKNSSNHPTFPNVILNKSNSITMGKPELYDFNINIYKNKSDEIFDEFNQEDIHPVSHKNFTTILKKLSLEQKFDDFISKNLKTANIAYNAPKIMQKNKIEKIHLIISKTKEIEDLKKLIQGLGDKNGTTIEISPIVKATLTGDNFKIIQITPEEQIVTKSMDTNWKWDVIPLKEGSQKLNLSISAQIIVDGVASKLYGIDTFETYIQVKVETIDALKEFLQNNWQWLIGSLFIPFIIWYLQKDDSKKEKKEKTKANKTAEEEYANTTEN